MTDTKQSEPDLRGWSCTRGHSIGAECDSDCTYVPRRTTNEPQAPERCTRCRITRDSVAGSQPCPSVDGGQEVGVPHTWPVPELSAERESGYGVLLRTVASTITGSDPMAAQALERAACDVDEFCITIAEQAATIERWGMEIVGRDLELAQLRAIAEPLRTMVLERDATIERLTLQREAVRTRIVALPSADVDFKSGQLVDGYAFLDRSEVLDIIATEPCSMLECSMPAPHNAGECTQAVVLEYVAAGRAQLAERISTIERMKQHAGDMKRDRDGHLNWIFDLAVEQFGLQEQRLNAPKPTDCIADGITALRADVESLKAHDAVVQTHYRDLETQNFKLTHEVESLKAERVRLRELIQSIRKATFIARASVTEQLFAVEQIAIDERASERTENEQS